MNRASAELVFSVSLPISNDKESFVEDDFSSIGSSFFIHIFVTVSLLIVSPSCGLGDGFVVVVSKTVVVPATVGGREGGVATDCWYFFDHCFVSIIIR